MAMSAQQHPETLCNRLKPLSYTIYLEIVLSTKVCDQKHGGFYVTIDLFSWGFPLTHGSNVRGRQSSTPPDFTVIYHLCTDHSIGIEY